MKEHTFSVKARCESYGKSVGIEKIAGLAGLLHDFGKLSPLWQVYLHENDRTKKIDHATWGAVFLCNKYFETSNPDKIYQYSRKFIVEVISNAICGHHSQLADVVNLDGKSPFIKRLLKDEVANIKDIEPIFEKEIMPLTELDELVHLATLEYVEVFRRVSKEYPESSFKSQKRVACLSPLFAHHVYSILVDADRSDTRVWKEGRDEPLPKLTDEVFMETLENNLNSYIEPFQNNLNPTYVNKYRQSISDECFKNGSEFEPGIYRLATPVGAGKTISSLRFAIEHAKKHNKERIFYILPLTAIIEQNAKEVREVLKGEEWLLEHHGQVLLENDKSKALYSMSLAKDNWDAPIVFTTIYQYLMAFYGGKGRDLRRLHNLTNSIVIFDEVQSVPHQSVGLFSESVNYLNEVGNTTSILCTATQPTLNRIVNGIRSEINPIVKEETTLANVFKRVEFHSIAEKKDTSSLSTFVKDKSREFQSILIILNTKKVVHDLYVSMKKKIPGIPIYHLSTSMCPSHRTNILDRVKEHLNNDEAVICISTALIEAGVDISFQAVVRSLAGLDSIAQASGRCNRHGELNVGKLFLIDHSEENLRMLPTIQLGKQITKDMLRVFEAGRHGWKGDIISPEAMIRYYNQYFKKIGVETEYYIEYKGNKTHSLYELMFKNLNLRSNYIPFNLKHNHQTDFSKRINSEDYPFVLDSAFRTVSENYKVYDKGDQLSVVVPYGKGSAWVEKLQQGQLEFGWQKKIQAYTIALFTEKVEKMERDGAIRRIKIKEEFLYTLTEQSYSEEYGLLH